MTINLRAAGVIESGLTADAAVVGAVDGVGSATPQLFATQALRQLIAVDEPASIAVGTQKEYLAPDDSSADARASNSIKFSAAATYALNNAVKEIVLGAGTCWFDDELGLGNSGADQKSLHLKGSGGGAVENQNTVLRFPDVTTAALIVGNGQFMQVSDLAIVGETDPTSRAALTGVGIGFNHNTHQIRCDNVRVVGFATCYKTGYNGDVLCDSTSFFKCGAIGHTGWHFSQTQNYINSLYDCVASCKVDVLSDVGKAVNIYGGNYSTSDAKRNAFTIGSVSGLTPISDNSQLDGLTFDNATFTAVVSSPDQPMLDGAYDAFVINNTAFGPIPLLMTNFNAGTSTITLKFHAGWLLNGTYDLSGALGTLLAAELAAATTLYACETITTFRGHCFNVDGIHIENPGAYHRLYYHHASFAGDYASHFNRITFNSDISQTDSHGGTAAEEAAFLCQQAFPFIQFNNINGRVELSNIVNVRTANPVLIEPWGNDEATHRLIVRNCDLRPVVRVPSPNGALFGSSSSNRRTLETGWGSWDDTPFVPAASDDSNALYARERLVGLPYEGHFPAPWAQLTIHADQLTDIENGLGAVGTYLPLFGRRPYVVLGTAATGAVASRWAESDHLYWSYGQNLTVDWDYVGGTNVLLLSDTTRMFAGLVITLDNGGGDVSYIVTGVYPALGFVTVIRTNGGVLAGTVGDDHNGATVKQAAYSLTYAGLS